MTLGSHNDVCAFSKLIGILPLKSGGRHTMKERGGRDYSKSSLKMKEVCSRGLLWHCPFSCSGNLSIMQHICLVYLCLFPPFPNIFDELLIKRLLQDLSSFCLVPVSAPKAGEERGCNAREQTRKRRTRSTLRKGDSIWDVHIFSFFNLLPLW